MDAKKSGIEATIPHLSPGSEREKGRRFNKNEEALIKDCL
jgi:hypothetical protein